MLIEIKQDIIDDAINKKDLSNNETIDLLMMMAFSVKHGKHIVYVPCLRTNPKKLKEMISLIGASNAKMLNFFNTKVYGAKQLISLFSVKAIISFKKPIEMQNKNTERIIWINPVEKTNFEPWVETFVLTENLLDSEFFSYLIRYYLTEKKIRDVKYNFYALMGGW